MAKILIEVDDERIERLNKIKNGPWGSKNLTNDELMILNGTVLPETYGDLIDRDVILKMKEQETDLLGHHMVNEYVRTRFIKDYPPVIRGNKEVDKICLK